MQFKKMKDGGVLIDTGWHSIPMSKYEVHDFVRVAFPLWKLAKFCAAVAAFMILGLALAFFAVPETPTGDALRVASIMSITLAFITAFIGLMEGLSA